MELNIIRNNHQLPVDGRIYLNLSSMEWRRWMADKELFTIRAADIGQRSSVIAERERNFNGYLISKFLDGFSPALAVHADYIESIVHPDNYPVYFWDKATCVSGHASSSGDMMSIKAILTGIPQAIEVNGTLWFKYYQLLPEVGNLRLKIVVKWHKALLSLYHMMKNNREVNFPFDFEKIKRTCLDEMKTVTETEP